MEIKIFIAIWILLFHFGLVCMTLGQRTMIFFKEYWIEHELSEVD